LRMGSNDSLKRSYSHAEHIFCILSATPCKGSQYVIRRHPLKQQALENVRTVSTTAKGRNYKCRYDVG
jgi:hypothetical protein